MHRPRCIFKAVSLITILTAIACGTATINPWQIYPDPQERANEQSLPKSPEASDLLVVPQARLSTTTLTGSAPSPMGTVTREPPLNAQPTPTLIVPTETSHHPKVVSSKRIFSTPEMVLSSPKVSPVQASLSTVEVVRILSPSVVQIANESFSLGFFNQPIPSRGVGSGIILDTDGHILTNYHVVGGAKTLKVSLSDGRIAIAKLVGRDDKTDLAVIRIQADNLIPANLGMSASLEVGEDVIAIGHALGLPGGPTVSKGVVSAIGRTIETDMSVTIVDLIQTDASINPGNSGGPLVNSHAEIVGINMVIIQGGRGIGFAFNIDDAKIITSQLIDYGYVNRGFLGINPFNVTASLANQLSLPITGGIIVGHVVPGGAADNAGILLEDIVVQAGDDPIMNTGDLSKFLIANPPNSLVSIGYYRNGTLHTTWVDLGSRPAQ